jgi:chromosome segregation ATPase
VVCGCGFSILKVMGKTLTYEQMMALFAEGNKETAELRKEHKEGMAELRNNIAEGRKETAELRASIADLRILADKNNERLDKISVDLKNNTREMGLLTNKLGGIVESIVLPGIVGKFNEKGFSFDSVSW